MRKNVTDDVFFEIAEHLGVLRESPSGWAKELNRIAWNGGQIKFDIREWNPEHDRMARGITLTDEEMQNLYQYFCHWKKSDHSLDSPFWRVDLENAWNRDAFCSFSNSWTLQQRLRCDDQDR